MDLCIACGKPRNTTDDTRRVCDRPECMALWNNPNARTALRFWDGAPVPPRAPATGQPTPKTDRPPTLVERMRRGQRPGPDTGTGGAA